MPVTTATTDFKLGGVDTTCRVFCETPNLNELVPATSLCHGVVCTPTYIPMYFTTQEPILWAVLIGVTVVPCTSHGVNQQEPAAPAVGSCSTFAPPHHSIPRSSSSPSSSLELNKSLESMESSCTQFSRGMLGLAGSLTAGQATQSSGVKSNVERHGKPTSNTTKSKTL